MPKQECQCCMLRRACTSIGNTLPSFFLSGLQLVGLLTILRNLSRLTPSPEKKLRISRVSTKDRGQYLNVTRGDCYNQTERQRLSSQYQIDMLQVVHRCWLGSD